MAYDPKKKRPTRDSLDAVVDEIFGEEADESTSAKEIVKEKPSTQAQKPKKASASQTTTAPQKSTDKSKATAAPEKDETPDNVLPLYPESPETPLIMQPQVWIATGITALIILFIARKRKKR